jgi:hypothetical protein
MTARPGLVLVTKAGASGELLAKLLDAHAAEPGAVVVDVVVCGVGTGDSGAGRRPHLLTTSGPGGFPESGSTLVR